MYISSQSRQIPPLTQPQPQQRIPYRRLFTPTPPRNPLITLSLSLSLLPVYTKKESTSNGCQQIRNHVAQKHQQNDPNSHLRSPRMDSNNSSPPQFSVLLSDHQIRRLLRPQNTLPLVFSYRSHFRTHKEQEFTQRSSL